MEKAELKEIKKDLETLWREAHASMERWVLLYQDKFASSVAEGFQIHRTGWGAFLINRATDHVIVDKETITVPQKEGTKEAQAKADKKENFFQALIASEDMLNTEKINKTLAKQALLFGVGTRKGPLWNDKYPLMPLRRKKESREDFKFREWEWRNDVRGRFPFKFSFPDPRTILFPIDTFPLPYVLEVGKKRVGYLRERYGVECSGKADKEFVDWLEYWSPTERLFIIDGDEEVLEDTKNIGGFIPYEFVFTGFGLRAQDGGSESPELLCRGLLAGQEGPIEALTRIGTSIDTLVQLAANRNLYLKGADPAKIKWGTGPGNVVELPAEVEIVELEYPAVIPDAWRFFQDIQGRMMSTTIGRVLSAEVPAGVTSGAMQAILVGQAELLFRPLLVNLALARRNYLRNVGKLLDALGEKITLWSGMPKKTGEFSIGPEDFNGFYEVNVELPGETPTEAERQGVLGLNYWVKGALSLQTVWEKFIKIADTTEERKRLILEQALKHPLIQGALAKEAYKQFTGEEFPLQPTQETQPTQQEQPFGLEGTQLTTPVPERPPAQMPGGTEELGGMISALQTLGREGRV